MPPCLCVCALVCLGGGGGHLLAPLLFRVGARGTGKRVPRALGPGREAREPNAEPARGDVGLDSQPPRHKDKLPNCSTTACQHGKAVVPGTTGVSLTAFGIGGAARWAGSGSPRPRVYPGQVEGSQGAESASLPWCHWCWLHRQRRHSPRRPGGPKGTPEWPLHWEGERPAGLQGSPTTALECMGLCWRGWMC